MTVAPNRIQREPVSDKRRRWFINIVLILSVLSFFGIYLVPLISGSFQANQVANTPSPTPTVASTPDKDTPEARKADLEAQVRGYELVLQREPENPTALQGLLEARLQLLRDFGEGDPKTLVGPLEKLAKLKPEETNYTVLLAQARDYLGDREGAAQAYRSALNKKPGDPYALTGFANLYLKQSRPEAAIALLKETLEAAPQTNQAQPGTINVATVKVMLGEVYTKLKRYDEAIAIYNEAIQTDAKDFRPVLGKAKALKDQGKTTEAKQLFNTAFNLAPATYKDPIKAELDQLSGSNSAANRPPAAAANPAVSGPVPASPPSAVPPLANKSSQSGR